MISYWNSSAQSCTSPLIATTCGNQYILTVSDYCTKWVEAIPTPTKQASKVSNALFK
uniref:Integrase catalytic domain-containing protein n=1 Tax=Amphimedon queenslandica TaxID=400682 RepID=A0A1X7U287_AMPQE